MSDVIEAPAPETEQAETEPQVCTRHPRYELEECGQPAEWAVGHHGDSRVVCEPCLIGMLSSGFWCNVCAVDVPSDDMSWTKL